MRTEIKPATVMDYMAYYKSAKFQSQCVWDGEERVGMFGVIIDGGQNWAYLDTCKEIDTHVGLAIIRKMRDMLRNAQEIVFVTCDYKTYATAPRLLKAVGFVPTGETLNDHEVWIWTPA